MQLVFARTARKLIVLTGLVIAGSIPLASAQSQYTVTVPWPDGAVPESNLFSLGWVIRDINTNPWPSATIAFAIPGAPDITGTWYMTNPLKAVTINGDGLVGQINGTLSFAGRTTATRLDIGSNTWFEAGPDSTVSDCWFRRGSSCHVGENSVVGPNNSFWEESLVVLGSGSEMTAQDNGFGGSNVVQVATGCNVRNVNGDVELQIQGSSNQVKTCQIRRLIVTGDDNRIEEITVSDSGPSYSGIVIDGNRNRLKTGASFGHQTGIYLAGHSNTVVGFRVGYSMDGNESSNEYGIVVQGNGHQLGDVGDTERNWIIKCQKDGIKILWGKGIRLWNNYIGVRENGLVRSNGWVGIRLMPGSGSSCVEELEIGGDSVGKGNTIVANGLGGIYGWDGPFLGRAITIQNNRIGIRQPLFFLERGEEIGNGAGADANGIRLQNVEGLTISNNWVGAHDYYGIFLQGCSNAMIRGNRIGTDGEATNAFPNRAAGLRVRNCIALCVGGTNATERNVISGNANPTREGYGIYIDGQSTSNVAVQGNIIGINGPENGLLKNGDAAVLLYDVKYVTVGGNGTNWGNVIGGSPKGVYLLAASQCEVAGNWIGVSPDGENVWTNQFGVVIDGGVSNRIGGGAAAGNVIAGSLLDGVWIANGTRHAIQGNCIGLTRGGQLIGNRRHGIVVGDYLVVNVNYLGGGTNETGESRGNVIAGNASNGVRIAGSYTSWNYLDGNTIYSNGEHGVYISCGDNWIGMTTGNHVFANGKCGIYLTNCQWNIFRNNFVGLSPDGAVVGNGGPGILLDAFANYNTLGGVLTNGNVVVGASTNHAVWIRGAGNNSLSGNFFGAFGGAAVRLEDTATANTLGGALNEGNIVVGASTGIEIVRAHGQRIYGNWIGFIPDHVTLPPAVTNFYAPHRLAIGIRIVDGRNNSIAGSIGNSIGGVRDAGILIESSGGPALCASNSIYSARIGCARQPLGGGLVTNEGDGIVISNSGWNQIGSRWTTNYNYISGNRVGLRLYNALSNLVQNNTFGLSANGFLWPNRQTSIQAERSRGDLIGGSYASSEGNRIVGTGYSGGMTNAADVGDGILLIECAFTVIQGNEIGWDRSINAALPNARHGVCVVNSTNIQIGGSASFRNYLSGNLGHGLMVTGKASTVSAAIHANRIGLAVDGVTPAPNGGCGILLDSTRGNIIGNGTLDWRNIISGNREDGIRIRGADSEGNQVNGNYVGTDWTGTTPCGNRGNGIAIEQAPRNAIVSTGAVPNVVAASGLSGILISGTGSTENQVVGNWIGLGTNGVPMGNTDCGIKVWNASGNVLSNNRVVAGNGHGVFLGGETDMETRFNIVTYNHIGTTPAGAAMTNRGWGVRIENASRNTIGPGNVVCANGEGGISVVDARSFDNEIVGNSVGHHPFAPNPVMPNGGSGILLDGGGANRVGGTNTWQANQVAHNLRWGVHVTQGRGNHVLGNTIYSNMFRGIRLGEHATPYPQETDQSPNRSQRAPRLTQATLGSLTLSGILESGANQSYWLEFFLLPSNADLRAEGQWFLGRTNLVTDGTGRGDFTITFSGGVADLAATGMMVTATATDTNGNTSAFSTPWIIGFGVPPYVTNAPIEVPVNWFTRYGITNNLEQANLTDLDGDGVLTWQEYVMDTDPTDRTSCLRQTDLFGLASDGFVVQWPGSPERLYSVKWSGDLSGGFPETLAEFLHPSTYGTMSYTDRVHHAESKSFYRIHVLVP